MDDLLGALLAAPSGLDAQQLAKDLCAAGGTDALADALHRRLVRDGILGRDAFERFEAALDPPAPRTPDDDLWDRVLQAAGDEAAALIEELASDGRLDGARRLVVTRWEGVDCYAPEGRRFYGVLRAMVKRMPPGRERGELLFLSARVGCAADGDVPTQPGCRTRSERLVADAAHHLHDRDA